VEDAAVVPGDASEGGRDRFFNDLGHELADGIFGAGGHEATEIDPDGARAPGAFTWDEETEAQLVASALTAETPVVTAHRTGNPFVDNVDDEIVDRADEAEKEPIDGEDDDFWDEDLDEDEYDEDDLADDELGDEFEDDELDDDDEDDLADEDEDLEEDDEFEDDDFDEDDLDDDGPDVDELNGEVAPVDGVEGNDLDDEFDDDDLEDDEFEDDELDDEEDFDEDEAAFEAIVEDQAEGAEPKDSEGGLGEDEIDALWAQAFADADPLATDETETHPDTADPERDAPSFGPTDGSDANDTESAKRLETEASDSDDSWDLEAIWEDSDEDLSLDEIGAPSEEYLDLEELNTEDPTASDFDELLGEEAGEDLDDDFDDLLGDDDLIDAELLGEDGHPDTAKSEPFRPARERPASIVPDAAIDTWVRSTGGSSDWLDSARRATKTSVLFFVLAIAAMVAVGIAIAIGFTK
jgi:hypothetical protein